MIRNNEQNAQQTAVSQPQPAQQTATSQPQPAQQTATNQPQPAQQTTVTQVSPDDILASGGPITPSTADGTPTKRQLEQDVITVNPSIDSMDSRG